MITTQRVAAAAAVASTVVAAAAFFFKNDANGQKVDGSNVNAVQIGGSNSGSISIVTTPGGGNIAEAKFDDPDLAYIFGQWCDGVGGVITFDVLNANIRYRYVAPAVYNIPAVDTGYLPANLKILRGTNREWLLIRTEPDDSQTQFQKGSNKIMFISNTQFADKKQPTQIDKC